jgi:molybdopterin synthase catalytic subunit
VEVEVFKIVEQPIASDALYNSVLEDHNGAVVTFAGVVRNHSGEKRTDYLVYEAYKDMAEKKMAEVGDEVRARWQVGEVAALHRIGRLEIGEISVLIAIGSPHRAEAFEACRYYIDRLKEVVPIWKKEVGEDGEEWVEGPRAASDRSIGDAVEF